MAADREWFAAHPDRAHRLRRPYPGEPYPDDGAADFMLVRQVAPGTRMRLGVKPTGWWPNDETVLAARWNAILEAQPKIAAFARLAASLAPARRQ